MKPIEECEGIGIRRTETDLLKLRRSSILQPGESAFYEPLVSLLEEGGLIHGSELLSIRF